MECDFQAIGTSGTVVTRSFKIDFGRFISETVRARFSYEGESSSLHELYKNNQCFQSVEQLCQPWIQLTYEMERSLDGTDHHRCKCLRYLQTITAPENRIERFV